VKEIAIGLKTGDKILLDIINQAKNQ